MERFYINKANGEAFVPVPKIDRYCDHCGVIINRSCHSYNGHNYHAACSKLVHPEEYPK